MIKIGHKFNIKPTHCFFAHIPNALKKFSLMKLQHVRCSPYTVRQCLLEQSASLGYIRLERGLLEQLQHDQPWEYKTVSVNWCLFNLYRGNIWKSFSCCLSLTLFCVWSSPFLVGFKLVCNLICFPLLGITLWSWLSWANTSLIRICICTVCVSPDSVGV